MSRHTVFAGMVVVAICSILYGAMPPQIPPPPKFQTAPDASWEDWIKADGVNFAWILTGRRNAYICKRGTCEILTKWK